MSSPVAADRTSFDPIGAGALLVGVLLTCLGIGALVGLAAGSTELGIAIGAAAGIPAGVFAVYRRYRRYFLG